MKQNRVSIRILFITLFLMPPLLLGCVKTSQNAISQPTSQSELHLGTICKITIYDDKPQKATFDAAFSRIAELEQKTSLHLATSEIAQVNAMAGKEAVVVSNETFFLIQEALRIAELSGGAFDPTIGAVVQLWNIGGEFARRPAAKEIEERLPLVDWRLVELNVAEQSVYLPVEGMVLDLGGIAKGYVADEVARLLREGDVQAAIINLGGNVLTVGTKRDQSPWNIGVQKPDSERGEYSVIVKLGATSLVTSGPYERYFVEEGVRYHHILNPKTGYPVENNLSSVSVICEDSYLADALSTAFYVLGSKEALELAKELEGVEILMMTSDYKFYVSAGLSDGTIAYQITDTAYRPQ